MAYIYWNPDGTLIDLGFYVLRWYSVLFALGFVFSYIILKKQFAKDNVPDEKLQGLIVYVVLATVIGARLGHCLFYDFEYYSQHVAEIFLPFRFEPSFQFVGYQGLASHGGAIAILIALIFYARKYDVKLFWILDKLALVIPLAGCFIRLGNLMNSEIIGKPSTAAWAFIFQKVDNVPRHPGQLYEAIAYLAIFVFLYILNKKINKEQGFIFGLFLTLLFSARFVIEFFKADQSAFEAGMAINMGQALSVPFIVFGLILILLKRNNKITPSSADAQFQAEK